MRYLMILALMAAACAPPSPPAGCVRLALSHSEDPDGARKAISEVIVCDQASVGSLPAGTLFIDLKAVGPPDELRAEVQAPKEAQ